MCATGIILLTGCASIPGYIFVNVDTTVGDPFLIYSQNENTMMSVGSHVFLSRISDQRVALTYWPGHEVRSVPLPNPWPMYSDDLGESWTYGNPYTWVGDYDFPNLPDYIEAGKKPAYFFKGFFFSEARFEDGYRVAFTRHAKGPRFEFYRIASEDDGITWSLPDKIALPVPEQLASGALLNCESPAVMVGESMYIVGGHRNKYGRDGKYHTLMFRSDDRGRSFVFHSIVVSPEDVKYGKAPIGGGEPALLALSSNEFICVVRTGNRVGTAGISMDAEAEDMLLARSYDRGETWVHRRIPVQGVMPKLLRMSNGILVLATGRPGNRLYFSLDNGRSWGGVVSLVPHGLVMTSGYMDLEEVDDGKLLVVYDLVNAPLDRSFTGDEASSLGSKIGAVLSDVIMGPAETWSTNRYNQIIGRFITVTRR